MAIYRLDSSYTWWLLLPVVGALALSVPLSVYSSRVSLGRLLRRAGLLTIPEETDPPGELRALRGRADGLPGFVDAVVNPRVNSVAAAVSCARAKLSPRAQARRHRAVAAAVKEGPLALSDAERLFFLTDSLALVGQHGVYCRSERFPGQPKMDVALVLEQLNDAKELVQRAMEELKR